MTRTIIKNNNKKDTLSFHASMIWIMCVALLGFGTLTASAEPFNDAYAYLDRFADETGLNAAETLNISVSEGTLTADADDAVAVSECINLPQPEGGHFQGWSSAVFTVFGSVPEGQIEVQDCGGNTLISGQSLTDGETILDISSVQKEGIRLKWIAAQAGSQLNSWGVYGRSDGVTQLQVLPDTDAPQSGDTLTFTIHLSSSGAVTQNPILTFSLDDINGLHTPDVDDGLADDAEMIYRPEVGLRAYQPLEFAAASAGPQEEQPEQDSLPAVGDSSGEIVWKLKDLSDGFSDHVTVTLRIPSGYIDGKKLAARAELSYGAEDGGAAHAMTIEAVSEKVSVDSAHDMRVLGWSPFSRVEQGVAEVYDRYTIYNHLENLPNASEMEDVTLTISGIGSDDACTPLYEKVELHGQYAFHILKQPEAGQPLTPGSLVVRFDRAIPRVHDMDNEMIYSAMALVYYTIPEGCTGGKEIGTQAQAIGQNPAWTYSAQESHDTPIPGEPGECRQGYNYVERLMSGNDAGEYIYWPGWNEFYIAGGSVRPGEYFLSEAPRGRYESRNHVVPLEHSYAVTTVPEGVSFHGVRRANWSSGFYKDCSGQALLPTDENFTHGNPEDSGWKPIEWQAASQTWNEEMLFHNQPNDDDPKAVVPAACRLLAVKDTDNPAWQGEDFGNWQPYFLWQVCDGTHCDPPEDGTPLNVGGGGLYTYVDGTALDCTYSADGKQVYAPQTVYAEQKSWPKIYVRAEQDQTAAGETAHLIITPENDNNASEYVDGVWGVNLFAVKDFIDLRVSGEILDDGVEWPKPGQNVEGESCEPERIAFHAPDLKQCENAEDADDAACFAWWDVPAACQPPNGWGLPLSGEFSHDNFAAMPGFRLNIPLLTSIPADTKLAFTAEVRTRDRLTLGADNAVNDPARWDRSNYRNDVVVTALEVPGVDAELSAPVTRNIGDIVTYALQIANSGNAPNNGIYGVLHLPKQNVNGSEFTPEYEKVYLDRAADGMLVEYTTEAACFTEASAVNWMTTTLQPTTRDGYQAETMTTVGSDATCVRIRRHPMSTESFEPEDSLLAAFDVRIPDQANFEGKWLYSRALTGANAQFGADTGVAPVETIDVRTLVGSGVVIDIEKIAEIDPMRAGYVTWTLRVYNTSGSIARNISVLDDLPDELVYEELAGALPNGWTCESEACAVVGANADGSGGQLRVTIAELAPDDGTPGSGDDEDMVSFRTRVKDGVPEGTTIENSASAMPEIGTGGQDNAQISTPDIDAVKAQNIIDRDGTTAIPDVKAGDIFTYLITATSLIEEQVRMTVYDALDSSIDYVTGSLRVNEAVLSDAWFQDGILNYQHTELLGQGETLALSFDVQVNQRVSNGWVIENVATVTASPNGDDLMLAKETNWTYTKVLAPEQEPTPAPSTVPEPSTLLFMGSGFLGIIAILRKRRKK